MTNHMMSVRRNLTAQGLDLEDIPNSTLSNLIDILYYIIIRRGDDPQDADSWTRAACLFREATQDELEATA